MKIIDFFNITAMVGAIPAHETIPARVVNSRTGFRHLKEKCEESGNRSNQIDLIFVFTLIMTGIIPLNFQSCDRQINYKF